MSESGTEGDNKTVFDSAMHVPHRTSFLRLSAASLVTTPDIGHAIVLDVEVKIVMFQEGHVGRASFVMLRWSLIWESTVFQV